MIDKGIIWEPVMTFKFLQLESALYKSEKSSKYELFC